MTYLDDRRNLKLFGKKAEEKKKYVIPKMSEKKKQAQASKGKEQTELQLWYEEIMNREDAICWETGKPIDKRNKLAWRGSIAHVLPKNLFKSVATHPMNYLILSMFDGAHGTYDSSWEKASKMGVFGEAVERFLIMYPFIAGSEKRLIPDQFLKHLK
jgi:hypothetical protein